MEKLVIILVSCVLLFASAVVIPVPSKLTDDTPAFRQEMLDEILRTYPEWTPSLNQGTLSGATIGQIKALLGSKRGGPVLDEKEVKIQAPPTAFDARTYWSNCTTIRQIRDQSACGSCWAFGAVEAMSDRYCIHNNVILEISAQDMNSCCTSCGMGCGGGYPSSAWQYWQATGVVSCACSPYTLPSCDHHEVNSSNPCPSNEYPTPPCVKKCNDTEIWNTALHHGKNVYAITTGNVDQIATEIMTNGPVETAFDVYEDFLYYTSGVYVHKTGEYLGGHAVKILGWGVDTNNTGLPYWIVANSWNPTWGLQGYFWIVKGRNEVGIESEIDAGIPLD